MIFFLIATLNKIEVSYITLFKEVIGNFVLQNLCICAATVKVCRLCTSDFAARSHARE